MESHFKSNNFVALVIALILIAAGFALAFIHRQSESNEKPSKTPVAAIIKLVAERDVTSA